MLITIDFLRAKGACMDGLCYFKKNFGESADYQAVLDKLAEDDRVSDARWLLDNAGADKEATREISEAPTTKHIFAAGRLEIKIDISVAGCVFAGGGIKAGWGIEAGGGIKAGEGIEAGLHIRCKTTLAFSFNLFAGTAVWKKTTEEDQLVECLELKGGEVRHGIIKMLKEA